MLRTLLISLLLFCGSAGGQTSALQWTSAVPSGVAPSQRFDAPIAYDSVGKQIVLFGGQDESGDRNDLWAFSVDRQTWTQLRPAVAGPAPRHGHTVTFDSERRRILIVAGQGSGFFNDTWAYDLASNSWSQLALGSAAPSPRYGHSTVYDAKRNRLILSHGFTSEQGRFDDTWVFEFATNAWRNITPIGIKPLRRCLHHAVYSQKTDEMLLFGGCSSGYGPCPQGDLWSFNLGSNQWTEITANPRPAPRERYGMAFDDKRNKLLLFAGLGSTVFNDAWEYDPASAAWKQITPAGVKPSARYRTEATFASDLGAAFFFGGLAPNLSNELLRLGTASAGSQITVTGILDVFGGSPGPFSPGEIVAIYGDSLGPDAGISSAFDAVTSVLPNRFGGASVTVGGIPAPIYYASRNQMNIQIPYEVAGQRSGAVKVQYADRESPEEVIGIVDFAPSLYPRVFNGDGSLNSADNPAAAGDVVVLFATGEGATNPPSQSGQAAGMPYPEPLGQVQVTIGGINAALVFAARAPGTAGIIQVNVRIPPAIAPSPFAPISLSVGGVQSKLKTSLALR